MRYLQTTAADIAHLAAANRLFHWHIEFPDIFTTGEADVDHQYGWSGGFDVIVGNPPWERLKIQEKEFFAPRDPDIADAPNAAKRKRLIAALPQEQPRLWDEYQDALRASEAASQFVRTSGRFPLTGRGDVNTYSVFAETFRDLINPNGRAGIITPTGIATDATTAPFIADTIRTHRLAAFFDFENEAKIFAGVHNQFRFAATVVTGTGGFTGQVRLAFYTRYVADVPSRQYGISPDEILMLNPNTGTLPMFRTRKDADITLGIYRRHPVLIRDGDPNGNPWGLKFSTMFHMANDSGLFRTAEDLEQLGATFDGWAWSKPSPDGGVERWLPLYEAKMLSHWNHRFSTYEGATQAQLNKGTLPRLTPKQLDDPDQESLPRYWVAETDIETAMGDRAGTGWLFGWRDITNACNERTIVPVFLSTSVLGQQVSACLRYL